MSHLPEQPSQLIPEMHIDALGHVLVAGAAQEGASDFNPKIEVLSNEKMGADRAQAYQMLVVDYFASDPVAREALEEFGLSGVDQEGRKNWTQLLEHIAGVTANALHLNGLLGKYGAQTVEKDALQAAATYDNLEKPLAITAGLEMAALRTSSLVHDIEKPAELDAARKMAEAGQSAGGLENSRDNPVLRAGRLWQYLSERGVPDDVILAAQNTGRSDRYFDELSAYDEKGTKKALEDRDNLEALLHEQGNQTTRDEIDAMTPDERRMASIHAKGPLAAIIGIADAVSAQFRFKGVSNEAIDTMAGYYLERKKDPESQQFFGQDWPAYYKQVRNYLISLVPESNREEFTAELDGLTEYHIFNETVLPEVLGVDYQQLSDPNATPRNGQAYRQLRYPIDDSPKNT